MLVKSIVIIDRTLSQIAVVLLCTTDGWCTPWGSSDTFLTGNLTWGTARVTAPRDRSSIRIGQRTSVNG